MWKDIITKQNQLENKKEYNIKKIKLEIEKEIKEKGFSIFKVNPQKRLQFFYYVHKNKIYKEEKESDALDFFIYFSLLTILCAFIPFFLIIVFPILLWFIFDKVKTIRKLQEKDIMSKFSGIKDEYSIITKDYIFLNNKFHERKDFEDKVFLLGNYYFGESYPGESEEIYKSLNKWNKQAKNISKLINSLSLLENYFEYIKELEKYNLKELKKIESGIYNFDKIVNNIEKIQITIQNILCKKNDSIEILENAGFKKYIDFNIFTLYLKKKFVFSVEVMKKILQRHINLIKNLEKNSKKNESTYIKLAVKRLEIYKRDLENQIQKLEQYII